MAFGTRASRLPQPPAEAPFPPPERHLYSSPTRASFLISGDIDEQITPILLRFDGYLERNQGPDELT